MWSDQTSATAPVDKARLSPARSHRKASLSKRLPGIFPVVHLDHIYYEGQVEVRSVELPRHRKALIASDHLPLVANLRIGF